MTARAARTPTWPIPDHTRMARGVLGDGPLLMPEQPVVLETDPSTARELARGHFTIYLTLPNYVNNLKRIGFTDEDFVRRRERPAHRRHRRVG